jgi:dihydrofolate synthase / folylpolyglutamate synthase
VEERIVIDGQPCSNEEFAQLIELIRPVVEALDREAACKNPPEHGPTYFEIITAAAWCHFARRPVDAAVLEVGLGGRLDSTNVCTPVVSLITSISFDHTKQLGDTLAAIAAEKAGIIKPGVPVISGVTADEPRAVVRNIAQQNGCRLMELGVDFQFDYRPPQHLEQETSPAHLDFRCLNPAAEPQKLDDIAIGLLGRHQAANAALVLATVEQLRSKGWAIPETAIRRGLADVVWPARVEVVARHPTVVLDAAHNAASIEALVEVLDESFSAGRRWLVFATTQEKDLRGMLARLLGRFDQVLFTRYLNNPRSVPPEELQTLAAELTGVRHPVCADPATAWDVIHRNVNPDDLICITGSFFIAAEMRRQLVARPLSQQL